LSAGSGTPRNRGSFALTWERGPWAVTGVLNYVGSMKMVDSKSEMAHIDDPADPTIVTDAANHLFWNNAGDLNCGVFDLTGNPYGGCKLPSFTTVDLFAKWTPMKNLDINFSIQNLFNKKAPFD